MTMIVVDKNWLYCFGGLNQLFKPNQTNQPIERLNTIFLDNGP
jgi:hypothetical protein